MRFFIADPPLIGKLKEQFVLLSNDENNWSKTYLDPVTGDSWFYYSIDSSRHGGGTAVFGKLPLLKGESLIDLVITSEYDDEVFAACKMLVENEEVKNIDFRLNLICRLEQLNNKSKRISIIEYTNLDSSLNRRGILGKPYDQIVSDVKYFKDISERAKQLM